MISVNGPRVLPSRVKKNLFNNTLGAQLVFFAVYLTVLICFILFGCKDDLISKLIMLVSVGTVLLIVLIVELINYRKYLYLAQYGKLTQGQIDGILIKDSSIHKLTYSYQVDHTTYSNTYRFSILEKELFKTGDSLDILYDESRPENSCVARFIFPDEYKKLPVEKIKSVICFIASALCIGLSVFEYYSLSAREMKSTNGFIKVYFIEDFFLQFLWQRGCSYSVGLPWRALIYYSHFKNEKGLIT